MKDPQALEYREDPDTSLNHELYIHIEYISTYMYVCMYIYRYVYMTILQCAPKCWFADLSSFIPAALCAPTLNGLRFEIEGLGFGVY